MDFDNLSNMHGMVRVYFDPDIDVYSDFTTKYQTSSDENGVFYDIWGYDNELEEDFMFLNPINRISKLNCLSEADRRSLELNIKKIMRKAVCDKFYYTIARRLFFAINSLIGNNRFTTVQQAYSYALSGETYDSPAVSAADFTTLAELYSCVWRAHNHNENGINELISLREMIILLEITHKNHVFKDNITTVLNMLAYVREESLIDRLRFDSLIDEAVFGTQKKTFNGGTNMDDLYNNIRFSDVLRRAENTDEVGKTLEFQRLVGSEPSLLLQFGTGFCNDFAIYNFCRKTNPCIYDEDQIFDIFIKDLEPNNLGATFMARIEAIIKNNSVKKPDISVNNEICSYISNLSTFDIAKYKNAGIGIDYYNAIVLYIFDKIKHFYNQQFSQKQVNTIASIIYYYLYPIYRIEGIIHDKSHDSNGENSLRFRLSKLSKIVENMVKDGDFCSYPSEFIEQKAKTLYFG